MVKGGVDVKHQPVHGVCQSLLPKGGALRIGIYILKGNVIFMGWRRMCLWTNRQWGYNLVKLWSKEVLMDRSRCRNIRTLGVTDIGSAGGDGDR